MSAQRFSAGLGEAPDDFDKDARVQFAGAEVVEEEQRLRAQHRDVVHAMVDQVLADGVVPVHGESDLQLGPHAIDARDEHRLSVLVRVEREQAAEPAHFAQHSAPARGSKQSRQCCFDSVPKIDVHSRGGVGFLFHVLASAQPTARDDLRKAHRCRVGIRLS